MSLPTIVRGIFGRNGCEGPVYADRVGGRLTFRDWDRWSLEDRLTYLPELFSRGVRP